MLLVFTPLPTLVHLDTCDKKSLLLESLPPLTPLPSQQPLRHPFVHITALHPLPVTKVTKRRSDALSTCLSLTRIVYYRSCKCIAPDLSTIWVSGYKWHRNICMCHSLAPSSRCVPVQSVRAKMRAKFRTQSSVCV